MSIHELHFPDGIPQSTLNINLNGKNPPTCRVSVYNPGQYDVTPYAMQGGRERIDMLVRTPEEATFRFIATDLVDDEDDDSEGGVGLLATNQPWPEERKGSQLTITATDGDNEFYLYGPDRHNPDAEPLIYSIFSCSPEPKENGRRRTAPESKKKKKDRKK